MTTARSLLHVVSDADFSNTARPRRGMLSTLCIAMMFASFLPCSCHIIAVNVDVDVNVFTPIIVRRGVNGFGVSEIEAAEAALDGSYGASGEATESPANVEISEVKALEDST